MQIFLGGIYDETINEVFNKAHDYYNYVRLEVNKLIENAATNVNSNVEVVEKTQLTRITEKEKMKKFMENEGYSIDRHNGDHAIYQNEDGHIVPVPVRDIGKGLSYAIQKQVLCS